MIVSAVGQCESAVCIHYAPSLLSLPLSVPPLPTLQVITEHRAELPALQSTCPLASCLHIMAYTSVLLPPFAPTSPSPTCPCSQSVCLCPYPCPSNMFICTIFLDSTHYLFFSLWFTSLCVWQSPGPSTSLQMTQFHSFLRLSTIPLYICITSFFPFICHWTSRLFLYMCPFWIMVLSR